MILKEIGWCEPIIIKFSDQFMSSKLRAANSLVKFNKFEFEDHMRQFKTELELESGGSSDNDSLNTEKLILVK
eukprot:Pgem_evm1s15635